MGRVLTFGHNSRCRRRSDQRPVLADHCRSRALPLDALDLFAHEPFGRIEHRPADRFVGEAGDHALDDLLDFILAERAVPATIRRPARAQR